MIAARGGLQPTRGHTGAPGYDYTFVREVSQALGLFSWAPIRWELMRRRVSIEALLQAVLTAAQPWAQMMTDIIAMLQSASANHGGEGMVLELQFDELTPSLAQSLSSFRRQATTAARVTTLSTGPQWGVLNPYALQPARDPDQPRRTRSEDTELTPMLIWADSYFHHDRDQVGGRGDPPEFSTSGVPELDRELRRLHQFLISLVSAVRALGPTYNSRVHDRPQKASMFSDGWVAESIAGAEADYAMVSLAEIFEMLALRGRFAPVEVQAAAAELKVKLDDAPQGLGVQNIAQQLLDLLDLPAWQRRHELYSVWVSAVIARALPTPFSWSLVDGTLSYSFGGSQLASGPIGSGTWALWAELRRPLLNPVSRKRKNAVQPDYTLLSGADRDAAAAGLVVECKQYRIPSRRNFREALADYALAHPQAHVLLANYGPVSRDLNKELGREEPPVVAFGEVYPLGSGLLPFANAVAGAMTAMTEQMELESAVQPAAVEEAEGRAGPTRMVDNLVNDSSIAPSDPRAVAEVWLQWHNEADLDLYAHYRDDQGAHDVYHGARGSLEEFPWIELDHDVREGPGLETISIRRLMPGRYEFEVRLFEGKWPASFGVGLVRPGHARIRTIYPGPELSILVFELEPSDDSASP